MLLICSHADEVEDVALLEQRCARMVECVEAELRKQSAAQRAELARLRESEAAAPRVDVAKRLQRLEQSLARPLRVHPAGGRALAVSSKTLQGVDELRTLLLDTAFDKEAFPRFGEFQAAADCTLPVCVHSPMLYSSAQTVVGNLLVGNVEPGTYGLILRHLRWSHPDESSLTPERMAATLGQQLSPGGAASQVQEVRLLSSEVVAATEKEKAFVRYSFEAAGCQAPERWAVRYSAAKAAHYVLGSELTRKIGFPGSIFDGGRDMIHVQSNVDRRGEELRAYYEQLLRQSSDVLALLPRLREAVAYQRVDEGGFELLRRYREIASLVSVLVVSCLLFFLSSGGRIVFRFDEMCCK